MEAPTIRTERLVLRGFTDADREPYARMNADTRVMEHFPSVLTAEQSDAHVDHILAGWEEHGVGLWAVDVPGVMPFAGFVGLSVPSFDAPFTPCVEVGWRLAAPAWGQGYAQEGARAALRFGFDDRQLDEIVSFTTTGNVRSQRVMQAIGMQRDPAEDFDHPRTPGWHGQRHVLYRLPATRWRQYGGRP